MRHMIAAKSAAEDRLRAQTLDRHAEVLALSFISHPFTHLSQFSHVLKQKQKYLTLRLLPGLMQSVCEAVVQWHVQALQKNN